MKKNLLLLCTLLVVAFSACKKDSSEDYAAQQAVVDDGIIQAYLKANNIVATKDASGVYYEIVTPGTGAYPTATSTVNVTYTGKFIDGNVFDKGAGYVANLNGGVIKGWSYGLPHINLGGRINLYIPSALAYGPSGYNTIPANTVLLFTIDLNRIQ